MFAIGVVLNGRYELRRLLAHGGMGQVWVAQDLLLDRQVAVKCVDPSHLLTEPKAVNILRDEARTGAKFVGHPNVVCTLDLGMHSAAGVDTHYIVMEYVDGCSLHHWIGIHSSSLDPATWSSLSVYIAWEICKSISNAHSRGVIHRDIKPLNVFLSTIGITKVGDFGLARFVEAVTRAHTVWNAMSPGYAAPEQWRGEKPTKKTDVYQLGCTLYHLLSRRLPFDEHGLMALMNAHLSKTAEFPQSSDVIVPKKVSSLVLRCLSKDPSQRPELWEVFDALAAELRVTHKLAVDVTKCTSEVQLKASEITDYDIDTLKSEEMSLSFVDFAECHSEAISLVLSGCGTIRIEKEITAAPAKGAAIPVKLPPK